MKLQMKLDGNVAEYRNEIQKLTGQEDELVGKEKGLASSEER